MAQGSAAPLEPELFEQFVASSRRLSPAEAEEPAVIDEVVPDAELPVERFGLWDHTNVRDTGRLQPGQRS